jgi:hypothetical protein
MAVTETIRFGAPAQLRGFLFVPTESLVSFSLLSLWRLACFRSPNRCALLLFSSGIVEPRR